MSHAQIVRRLPESAQLSCQARSHQPLQIRITRTAALMHVWYQRIRQRRELRQLDTRILRDLGKTRLQARDEWRKPFWRE